MREILIGLLPIGFFAIGLLFVFIDDMFNAYVNLLVKVFSKIKEMLK